MEQEIREMLGLILTKLDRFETRMDRLETKMDQLETRMDRLETKMDQLESRQDEIYSIAKAIEHNNLVRGAEIDNLKFKTSHVEGTLNSIGDVITTRKAI